MHIQSWFADPGHRASGRIDFDRRTQRLDRNAAYRLLNLADPHGRAHVAVAADREEDLTTNLLPVVVPTLLYSAATKYTDRREVITRQRETDGADVRHDFILRGGRLYSWLPPEETVLREVADGPTDVVETAEWSSDPDRHRWLVQLLNYALQRDVSADCAWHGGRKIVYFRPSPDLTKPRHLRGTSGRQREVFKPKFKKKAPDEISYCKHAALEWQFLLLDGRWYCALTPTYHYTRDGYRDSLFLSAISRARRVFPSPVGISIAMSAVSRWCSAYASRTRRCPGRSSRNLAEPNSARRWPKSGGVACTTRPLRR